MRNLFLIVVLLFFVGCVPIQEVYITQPLVENPIITGVPTAGAVSIDITPPPGLPMGGYSISSTPWSFLMQIGHGALMMARRCGLPMSPSRPH